MTDLSDEEIAALRERTERQTAMLPGDGDPEEHPFESLFPTEGTIQRTMTRLREVHREAEENPHKGAVHYGIEPIPDMGGVKVPADPRNLTGTFVPVPPDQVSPPMRGGRKMCVQSFEEAKAELAEERAAEEKAQALDAEADVAKQEARRARLRAEPSGF